MKRKAFTLIEALVVIAIICIVAAILFPLFARSRENAHKPSCQSNLKQIGLGFAQYLQDYNEKYPNLSSRGGTYGWADALQPYLKSHQIFQCPSERNNSSLNPQQTFYTDFWFNARLAGVETKKLKEAATTVLSGDGNDGSDQSDARYSLTALPSKWIKDKNSPLYRHLDGANFSFADGHVKWYKPEKISNSPPGKGAPTFRVR